MSTKQRTKGVDRGAIDAKSRANGVDRAGSGPLGEAVRRGRAGLGLSLDELGRLVGCSKSHLSAIENGRGLPGPGVVGRLEVALRVGEGTLAGLAGLAATPPVIRRELTSLRERQRAAGRVAALLRGMEAGGLDEAFRSGELRALVERMSPEGAGVREVPLPVEVPVINRVAAGYPREFTDLGYPVGVADEYVRTPDLSDPDAFAARVVGDSMTPDYREGDVVIFSPARDVRDGSDCFARIWPDDEATFKRVYFEAGEGGAEMIRLQPLNPAYPARVLGREEVVGLFAAVSVLRSV